MTADSGVSAAEANCCLEFFSGSHGKWIPVDVIDRDPSGAVQVTAKPGVWLSAKDCKRKLRVRKDDPSVGSTITSAEAFLAKVGTPTSLYSGGTPTSRCSGVSPSNNGRPKNDPFYLQQPEPSQVQSARQYVGAPSPGSKPSSLTQSMISGMRAGNAISSGLQAAMASKMDMPNHATSEKGYPTIAAQADGATISPTSRTVRYRERTDPAKCSVFTCPRCGASDLTSFESAVQHCDEQAGNSDKSPTDAAPGLRAGRQRNGLRYVVNTATPGIPQDKAPEKLEPSRVEWTPSVLLGQEVKDERGNTIPGGDVSADTDSTRTGSSDPVRSAEAQAETQYERYTGEAIAYNLRGEPIIQRTVNPDTGAASTTVVNDDGTTATFGQNTLASLTSSDESDADTWIASLTLLETRGLVHEIGQVLLSTSQLYQYHLDKLQAIGEKANYAFFGLTEDASDADLDRAYKKMAKQMHPDKNGGTEAAKERFQQMKERYEALKNRRASGDGNDEGKAEANKDDDAEKGVEDKEDKDERRKEAYDEDDDAPKKEESQKISYDPTDRESLATSAKEMLQRLKAIEGSMETVLYKLRQHGLW